MSDYSKHAVKELYLICKMLQLSNLNFSTWGGGEGYTYRSRFIPKLHGTLMGCIRINSTE